MSKVNRRKEIKQKEELQAKFQLSISQANSKIVNWLKPSATIIDGTNRDELNESFLNLPIIPNGSSLSNLASNKKQHNTIKDFINLKEVKNFNSNKTSDDNGNYSMKTRKNESRPLNSLMNKLRDSNRNKSRQKNIVAKKTGPRVSNKSIRSDSDSRKGLRNESQEEEEDDDEESKLINSRSVKKGSNLLFEDKIKKKGKRPPF